MSVNTPSNNQEIKTIDDIERKMCPELKEWARNVQPYLIKRFLKIYESLKNGTQQLDDDTLEELNQIWEDYLAHKNLLIQAISWAKAAIISRNLSHGVWENIIFPTDKFQDFISFCDIGKIEWKTLWANKFETLLQKDAEKLKDSKLNKRYVELRQEGKEPIEAIKKLPWWEILMANMLKSETMLPSNDEVLEWSKMWNTDYCLGRVNTILWIIELNEWTDYLNKHFKYADVLKDWAEDVLKLTPKEQRDIWYLSEYLGTEDPHQILIYIDDNWLPQDIDTNQIWLEQMWYWIPWLKNITKTYEWKISEIAYEIYFLNYLNTYFNELKDLWEKKKMAKYIELCNKKYGLSYTILKRITNFAIQMDNPEMEDETFWEIKKLADEYACIKDTLAYQMKLNEWNVAKINEFIHKKYWPQFDLSDIQGLLGID